MAGLGAASGLGASAAGAVASETDEAAGLEESFAAAEEQAAAEVVGGEDLAAEPEPEADQVTAEEPEVALEEPQALAETEEVPSEVDAAAEEQPAEEAAPALDEAAAEQTDHEIAAQQEAVEHRVEEEAPVEDAKVAAVTAEHALPPAEDGDDSLLGLDFELPDEAADATADAGDELSSEFLEESPAAQEEQPLEAQAEAGMVTAPTGQRGATVYLGPRLFPEWLGMLTDAFSHRTARVGDWCWCSGVGVGADRSMCNASVGSVDEARAQGVAAIGRCL